MVVNIGAPDFSLTYISVNCQLSSVHTYLNTLSLLFHDIFHTNVIHMRTHTQNTYTTPHNSQPS